MARIIFEECGSRNTAKRRNPWAVRIAAVVGGYVCFETEQDYETWKKQK